MRAIIEEQLPRLTRGLNMQVQQWQTQLIQLVPLDLCEHSRSRESWHSTTAMGKKTPGGKKTILFRSQNTGEACHIALLEHPLHLWEVCICSLCGLEHLFLGLWILNKFGQMASKDQDAYQRPISPVAPSGPFFHLDPCWSRCLWKNELLEFAVSTL